MKIFELVEYKIYNMFRDKNVNKLNKTPKKLKKGFYGIPMSMNSPDCSQVADDSISDVGGME